MLYTLGFEFSFADLDIISYGLAWDMTDDTLWLNSFNNSLFHQYSKDGILLESTNFGANLRPTMGLEFDNNLSPVPVPASVWLFGTALIGFVAMSSRSKIA